MEKGTVTRTGDRLPDVSIVFSVGIAGPLKVSTGYDPSYDTAGCRWNCPNAVSIFLPLPLETMTSHMLAS